MPVLGAEHEGGPALDLHSLDVGVGLEQCAGHLLVICNVCDVLKIYEINESITDQYAHTSVCPFFAESMREVEPWFVCASMLAFASSRRRATCS